MSNKPEEHVYQVPVPVNENSVQRKIRKPRDPLPLLPGKPGKPEHVYESVDELNICPSAETLKDAKVTLRTDSGQHNVNLSCLKELLKESPFYSKLIRMDYDNPRGRDPRDPEDPEDEELYSSVVIPQLSSSMEGEIEAGGGKKRKRKTVRKNKKSKSVRKHKKTGKKHAKRHSKTMKRKGKQHHKRSKKHHKKSRK